MNWNVKQCAGKLTILFQCQINVLTWQGCFSQIVLHFLGPYLINIECTCISVSMSGIILEYVTDGGYLDLCISDTSLIHANISLGFLSAFSIAWIVVFFPLLATLPCSRIIKSSLAFLDWFNAGSSYGPIHNYKCNQPQILRLSIRSGHFNEGIHFPNGWNVVWHKWFQLPL